MKTILYILGGLFLLSRLNQSGVSVAGTVTAAASPFGTTPAGGGAGLIIPPGLDPFQNIYGNSGGGGAAPILPIQMESGGDVGSSFRRTIGPMIHRTASPGMVRGFTS